MLLLTRKSGQSITIQPGQGMDDATPIGTIFSAGPIEVKVNWVTRGSVGLGVTAHRQLTILRNEILLYDSFPLELPENYNWREVLARNVFELRERRKLSTQQLADKSHLAVTTIYALERGQGFIDLDDLEELANALAVNVKELLKD